MRILGGEPPHIEDPEPRFGSVLSKLNDMVYTLQDSIYNFNDTTQATLLLFSQNLSQFITDVVIPIDAHLNARGAVHNETKVTVGLGKKDNYRTATLAEQVSLAPLYAYVTPQGSKQAFINRNANNPFVPTNYQQNGILQFASYYYVNEFPVGIPSAPPVTRYFGTDPFVAMLLNDDRIVYSPASPTDVYEKQVAFISSPTNNRRTSRLSEVLNLNTRYLPGGWNMIGSATTDGRTALFKPLADKKVYDFKNQLSMPYGGRQFLLFSSFIGIAYKGIAVSSQVVTETVFSIHHRFFGVNALETDPTLIDVIGPDYQAWYTTAGQAGHASPLNGGHSYDIRSFVTLQPDQTIRMAGSGLQPELIVTSLMWNIVDYEVYLHVAVPVIVESPTGSRQMVICFMVSIIPGSLQVGGSGIVRQLGTLAPDPVYPNFTTDANSQYVKVVDAWDYNTPLYLPGVMLNSGDLLKSLATRNGVRIKRYNTGVAGLKAWLLGNRPKVDVREARTEMFSPSRHSPFGPTPERVIPISNLNGSTKYLVYGLDNEKGYFRWSEVTWNSASIVGAVVGDKFGIKYSDGSIPYAGLNEMPRGLSVYASKTANGIGVNPLVFTTENGYKAYSGFGYAAGVVSLGSVVTLSPGALVVLQANSSRTMANAKAFNPAIPDTLRAAQIQVYGLALDKAVIVISDGYSYAEAAVVPYTVANGVFQLDFASIGGLVFTRVTPQSNVVTGVGRTSRSGDGVWMTPSDMFSLRLDPNTYEIVISRPFGEVYGDLSFSLSLLSSNQPVLQGRDVNPARMYQNVYQIDAADELHPPLLIPNKGLYQCMPTGYRYATMMKEVNGVTLVDPYDVNEAGWVRLPSGSKVVLLGQVYILDRDYPVKVNTVGTSYCYLQQVGTQLVALASDFQREVNNAEVMFGIAVNGVLTVNESYIVMDKHVLGAKRHGSTIPVFEDNGGLGVNQFFTLRDVG